MSVVRWFGPNGLGLFRAQKVSDGPPELWTAIGVDRRGGIKTAIGRGWTARGAEIDALARLGADIDLIEDALTVPEAS